jgi:hypothetical protein
LPGAKNLNLKSNKTQPLIAEPNGRLPRCGPPLILDKAALSYEHQRPDAAVPMNRGPMLSFPSRLLTILSINSVVHKGARGGDNVDSKALFVACVQRLAEIGVVLPKAKVCCADVAVVFFLCLRFSHLYGCISHRRLPKSPRSRSHRALAALLQTFLPRSGPRPPRASKSPRACGLWCFYCLKNPPHHIN